MKLSDLTFLAIDTETNVPESKGDKTPGHELIEASAVLADVGEEDDVFVKIGENTITPTGAKPFIKTADYTTFMCKPPSPMSPEASAVNGFRDEDFDGFPPVSEVLPKFMKRINGAVWVIHNAAYDWEILCRHCKSINIDQPKPLVVIDTLLLSRALLPLRKSHKQQVLAHLLKTKRMNAEAHRATSDCATLAMVFNKLVDIHLETGGDNTVESLLDLIKKQAVDVKMDSDMWFGKHKGTKIRELPIDYLSWWLFKKGPAEKGKEGDPKVDIMLAMSFKERCPNVKSDNVDKIISESIAKCSGKINWPSQL